jgi:PAS domain S-box-containing protein
MVATTRADQIMDARQKEVAALAAEHSLLRTLIDNLPDCIYAKDAETRKVIANSADLKNLGCKTEADAIGKTDFDLFPPDIAAGFFADDQSVLQTGQPVINREEMVVLRNGETRWLLTTKIPWRDAAGKIIGLIGIGRDVTDQMKAEIKLKEERNLLRTLMDNLPDSIYAKDAEARKILANPANYKRVGCKTEAEVIGKTDYDFYPPDIAAGFFADDQSVLQTGQSIINREEKIVLPNGETRWTLTTKAPWRDAAGKIIGLVGIGRDITERKNYEAQLSRAQRMESIGRLATGIAHDLNNTLAPILVSIDLLRQKIHDEEGLKILAAIEASAKRGAEVVKQVLWFGRGQEGRRMHVHLKPLIEGAARLATQTLPKSINIETQLDDGVWPIMGDPTQLHQVLLNLCQNASDAMPRGGRLKLAARNLTLDDSYAKTHNEAKPGPYVVLEISDTGGGISREIRDRIFEPFFTTKELGKKSVGLGLSTALSVIKSHDGFILVDSEVGKGSTFRLYLPAHVEAAATPADAKLENLLRGHGETILVVDDEEAVRQVTQMTLESCGYRVLLAPDGAKAMAIYAENQASIAAVLMDILMPVMNGVDTTRALQHINPRIKVIATSGYQSNTTQNALRDLGVTHFLPKPYTADAILQKLREVIAER